MRSLSDEHAFIQHKDLINVFDGGKAMRDDDSRFAFGCAADCLSDERLILGIQAGSCLVQNQYLRLFDERAGDADTLAFSAGQAHAAFADERIEPFFQAMGESVDAGGFCRRSDRLVGYLRSVRQPERNVVSERIIEKPHMLLYDADLPPVAVQIEYPKVIAINDDLALVRIIRPQDKIGDSGFPGAGMPDERHALSDFDRKVHVEDRAAVLLVLLRRVFRVFLVFAYDIFPHRVGERDVFEFNPAAEIVRANRILDHLHFRLDIQQRKILIHRSVEVQHLAMNRPDAPEMAHQVRRERKEEHKIAGRVGAFVHLVRADGDDRELRKADDHAPECGQYNVLLPKMLARIRVTRQCLVVFVLDLFFLRLHEDQLGISENFRMLFVIPVPDLLVFLQFFSDQGVDVDAGAQKQDGGGGEHSSDNRIQYQHECADNQDFENQRQYFVERHERERLQ